MKTENNNTTPLYKVLNEERTQGEWAAKKLTAKQLLIGLKNYGTTDFRTDNGCGQIAIIKGWDGYNYAELSNEDEANAKYICLAVNNFAKVCEALENFIWNFEGKSNLSEVQKKAIEYATEALKDIS